jgi:hypothetical protein
MLESPIAPLTPSVNLVTVLVVPSRIGRECVARVWRERQRRIEINYSANVLPDSFCQSIIRPAGKNELAIIEISRRLTRGCNDLVYGASRLHHETVGKSRL